MVNETNLLPVLRDKSAPMALCSICPAPGSCCRGFRLYHHGANPEERTFWLKTYEADVKEYLEKAGLEFTFEVASVHTVADPSDPSFGEGYVTISYSCDKVTADGRCSIYETRPQLCRDFIPGSNELCIFTSFTPRRQ